MRSSIISRPPIPTKDFAQSADKHLNGNWLLTLLMALQLSELLIVLDECAMKLSSPVADCLKILYNTMARCQAAELFATLLQVRKQCDHFNY